MKSMSKRGMAIWQVILIILAILLLVFAVAILSDSYSKGTGILNYIENLFKFGG